MKPKTTPAETLELACRLAEFMEKRGRKIERLTSSASRVIQNGEVVMVEPTLALIAAQAEGLREDVAQIAEMLARLPQIGKGDSPK